MARNYAALPHEYLEEMSALSDEEFGRLIRALLQYSATGQMPELTGAERILLPRVKMQEDRYRANYAELSEARSEAGKKGAQAKSGKVKQTQANSGKCKQAQAKHSNTETETNTNTDLSPSYRKEDHGARAKEAKEPKVQWAENVTMTNSEHEKLLAAHGPADTERLIEILDNYKGATGKKYASDYRAILSWVVDRLNEERGRQKKPDIRDMGAPGEYEKQALAKMLELEGGHGA